MGRVYSAQPGHAFEECVVQIRNAVAGLSNDLISADRPGYSPEVGDAILDGALAQYVDERFNVNNRNLLGWS